MAAGACLLLGALIGPRPVRAHADSPASPPLAPSVLKLEHVDASRIIALFSREQLPAPTEHSPRAARVDEADSLVPYGTEAVLRSRDTQEVILVGTEAVPELRDCIRVLDAPLEAVRPQRGRIVLAPKHGNLEALRRTVLHLPGAGSAVIQGSHLTLVGSPAWLFRAERQVIRGELGLPLGKQ